MCLLLLLKREVSQTIYTSACQQMMSMEMDLRVSLLSSLFSELQIFIIGWGLLLLAHTLLLLYNKSTFLVNLKF